MLVRRSPRLCRSARPGGCPDGRASVELCCVVLRWSKPLFRKSCALLAASSRGGGGGVAVQTNLLSLTVRQWHFGGAALHCSRMRVGPRLSAQESCWRTAGHATRRARGATGGVQRHLCDARQRLRRSCWVCGGPVSSLGGAGPKAPQRCVPQCACADTGCDRTYCTPRLFLGLLVCVRLGSSLFKRLTQIRHYLGFSLY